MAEESKPEYMTVVLTDTAAGSTTAFRAVVGKKNSIVFGRGAANSMSMPNDSEMSERHGRITLGDDGQLLYTDLNSRNGSKIGTVLVSTVPARLKDGDTLAVGSGKYIVSTAEPALADVTTVEDAIGLLGTVPISMLELSTSFEAKIAAQELHRKFRERFADQYRRSAAFSRSQPMLGGDDRSTWICAQHLVAMLFALVPDPIGDTGDTITWPKTSLWDNVVDIATRSDASAGLILSALRTATAMVPGAQMLFTGNGIRKDLLKADYVCALRKFVLEVAATATAGGGGAAAAAAATAGGAAAAAGGGGAKKAKARAKARAKAKAKAIAKAIAMKVSTRPLTDNEVRVLEVQNTGNAHDVAVSLYSITTESTPAKPVTDVKTLMARTVQFAVTFHDSTPAIRELNSPLANEGSRHVLETVNAIHDVLTQLDTTHSYSKFKPSEDGSYHGTVWPGDDKSKETSIAEELDADNEKMAKCLAAVTIMEDPKKDYMTNLQFRALIPEATWLESNTMPKCAEACGFILMRRLNFYLTGKYNISDEPLKGPVTAKNTDTVITTSVSGTLAAIRPEYRAPRLQPFIHDIYGPRELLTEKSSDMSVHPTRTYLRGLDKQQRKNWAAWVKYNPVYSNMLNAVFFDFKFARSESSSDALSALNPAHYIYERNMGRTVTVPMSLRSRVAAAEWFLYKRDVWQVPMQQLLTESGMPDYMQEILLSRKIYLDEAELEVGEGIAEKKSDADARQQRVTTLQKDATTRATALRSATKYVEGHRDVITGSAEEVRELIRNLKLVARTRTVDNMLVMLSDELLMLTAVDELPNFKKMDPAHQSALQTSLRTVGEKIFQRPRSHNKADALQAKIAEIDAAIAGTKAGGAAAKKLRPTSRAPPLYARFSSTLRF